MMRDGMYVIRSNDLNSTILVAVAHVRWLTSIRADGRHYPRGRGYCRAWDSEPISGARPPHLPMCDSIDFWICSLTVSKLKLAPFCIGGNSIAVCASFPTSCCTNWKRQNS